MEGREAGGGGGGTKKNPTTTTKKEIGKQKATLLTAFSLLY